jgi:diguanylate cyclase (GGDEF)-like protein
VRELGGTDQRPDQAAGQADPRQRLASLASVARALAGARSLPEVLQAAAREALFAFDATAVSLARLEPQHGLIRVLLNVGDLGPGELPEPEHETYAVADFPLLLAMVEEARPWLLDVDDPLADPAEVALLRRLGRHSGLAAPVLTEGRVWGELFVARSGERPAFGGDDLDFIQAFAGLVSSGLAQVEHLERVSRMAFEDPLTGLGNRRLVEQRLDEALARTAQGGPPVSLLMADVNRLKRANDRYGHEAGDRALQAVAAALAAAAGAVTGATAGRLGGDEFCVVMDGHGLQVALGVARDFVERSADAPYGISVAVGVASTEGSPGVLGSRQLLAWADEAQYEAKRTGSAAPVAAGAGDGLGRDRRRWRGQVPLPDLLGRGLARCEALRSSTAEERAVAVVSGLAEDSGAAGWVLAVRARGAATPLAGGAARDGLLLEVSVPAADADAWVQAAGASGLVVGPDAEVPLAGVRGCAQVAVGAAGAYVGELLFDPEDPAGELAPVLRALLAVAVYGP